MKITSLTQAIGLLNRVQSKGEGQSGRDSQQQRQQQSGREQEQKREVSEQEMNTAVAEFRADPQTRESGLTAETEGHGPGLRIVLKDSNGAVVRQLTGEEFMRLRQGVSKDQRSRGKILDQKL